MTSNRLTTQDYTTRTTCRVCGSTDLAPLFSLGNQYVSNFVEADQVCSGPQCPIDIELCNDCTLVQAKHTAPQEFLYTRHYWYRSGVTQTMRNALADVAKSAKRVVNLKPGDVVLDIGSNDGTLLRSYSVPDLITMGVEPAENLWEEGSRGITRLVKNFWKVGEYDGKPLIEQDDKGCGYYPPPGGFKAITALGMFYDLEDPNQFIADVAKVLHPEGVFIAQLMCLKQTLEKKDVGNFAHEHLEFYSLRSLDILLKRHGLQMFDVEENNVNGGSYRLYIRHTEPGVKPATDGYRRLSGYMLAEEEPGLALHDPNTYLSFFQELERGKAKVMDFIRKEVAAGKRVWIYGASTKGNVILQYYGLRYTPYYGDLMERPSLIEAAADRSPEKWGKYTVGTGIPIKSEEDFRKANPNYALVMPYAFINEFIQRESAWLEGGGKFIVPLPEPRVIRAGEGWIVHDPL